MIKAKLIELINNYPEYEAETIVYAVKPWTPESVCFILDIPEDESELREAKILGAEYFLETFLIEGILDGFLENENPSASLVEKCERVVYYAINDA